MIGFSQLGYDGFLGNQLFQYAMLKGVAAKTGFKPVIPKRYKFPPEQTPKNQMGWVQLEPFNVACEALPPHKFTNFFKEKHFHFNKEVFEIKDDTDFTGYYQSQKYFQHIENEIRQEFNPNNEIEAKANIFIAKLKKQYTLLTMKNKLLVSLHVRRGSYLDYPHTLTHKVVGKDYYKKAMSEFKDHIFLVFSDDVEWCKKEFTGNEFHICDTRHLVTPLCNKGPHQHGNHWLDLAIMSKCNHHIIAASTFSWWGAWLNPSKTKKIIAPKQWFGDQLSHLDTKDLLPDNWIKI